MHRCCAVLDSCQKFLTVKDATLSRFLDLRKIGICSASSSKVQCKQITVNDVGLRKLQSTSVVINQRRNNVVIVSRSNIFSSSLALCTSLGPNSFALAQQSRSIHVPIPFKKHQNENLRALDKIPSNFQCIYSVSMNIYLAYFHPIITFMSLGALVPFMLEMYYNGSSSLPESSENFVYFENTFQMLITLPIALGLTILSKLLTSRCPVRIYANEDDEFIAVFVTVLPWRTSKSIWTACSAQNLRPLNDERATLLTALRGDHIVNKKRMIILPYAFKYPHYYNVLLGNTLEHRPKLINEEDDK